MNRNEFLIGLAIASAVLVVLLAVFKDRTTAKTDIFGEQIYYGSVLPDDELKHNHDYLANKYKIEIGRDIDNENPSLPSPKNLQMWVVEGKCIVDDGRLTPDGLKYLQENNIDAQEWLDRSRMK